MSLEMALLLLPGLVIGLTVHEFAHAWSASLLGDDFPRRQGRVSLNPFRHLSFLGTLAIFLLPIGWGKPVQVNLYNFKHPKRDYLITSLAGPLANLLLAGICIALMQVTRLAYRHALPSHSAVIVLHYALMLVGTINIVLATVNLIPIPPLDGSKIWLCLIPGLRPAFGRKATWAFMVVLFILFSTKWIQPLIRLVLDNVQRIMPRLDGM